MSVTPPTSQQSHSRTTARSLSRRRATTTSVPRRVRRTRTSVRRGKPSAARLRFQMQYEQGLSINLQIGRHWLIVFFSIMIAGGLTQLAPLLKVL